MDRFERSAIRTLRLSRDGTTLEMSKDTPAAPALASPAAPAPAAAASAPCESTIDAPLAGVFYAASAPCDCVITRVLKENGGLAGYGEPLFGYRPC